eukprot:scaffold401914_cov18-Prasinocladus_malaysianus.AAC.1
MLVRVFISVSRRTRTSIVVRVQHANDYEYSYERIVFGSYSYWYEFSLLNAPACLSRASTVVAKFAYYRHAART